MVKKRNLTSSCKGGWGRGGDQLSYFYTSSQTACVVPEKLCLQSQDDCVVHHGFSSRVSGYNSAVLFF